MDTLRQSKLEGTAYGRPPQHRPVPSLEHVAAPVQAPSGDVFRQPAAA